MVAACFLSMNVSVGIVFTGYSPLILDIQEQFGTSRALASAAPSAASVSMGLLAPFIGALILRFSARAVLMTGALLASAGFVAVSFVDNIFILLGIYAAVIGFGTVSMGIVPCSTVITRWFNARRGTALGIINLFPGMVLFPFLSTFLLVNYGLKTVFLANAAIFALLLPVLLLISDKPQDRGLLPMGGAEAEARPAAEGMPSAPPGDGALLRNPAFWYLSFGIGLLTGAANLLSVHGIPMLLDTGVSKMQATSSMAANSLAVALVAPFFGLLIDRIGPMRGLYVEVGIVILPWVVLALVMPSLPVFTALVFVIGLANGGIVTLHATSAARIFPPSLYSRAIGLGYFIKMPFLLTSAPAAGLVFDETGSYRLAIAGGLTAIIIAGILFVLLNLGQRQLPAQPAPPLPINEGPVT
jgi:MFS family permease